MGLFLGLNSRRNRRLAAIQPLGADFVDRLLFGVGKRLVQPRHLRGVAWAIAVQRDKPGVTGIELIAIDVVHVERFVMLFEIAVVVAARGIKRHFGVKQTLVGQRKFAGVVVVVE